MKTPKTEVQGIEYMIALEASAPLFVRSGFAGLFPDERRTPDDHAHEASLARPKGRRLNDCGQELRRYLEFGQG